LYRKTSRYLTFAIAITLSLLILMGVFTALPDITVSRATNARAAPAGDNNITLKQTTSSYLVKSGSRLTYTISATNIDSAGYPYLHLTITDTLPSQVTTDANLAGTIVLPNGKLVWTAILAGIEPWTQQVVVTVANEYTGPLTNVVEITSLEGPTATSTHTSIAALNIHHTYTPIIIKNHPISGVLLVNPGFEGIGKPVDNNLPNPDNWTRDTFNGNAYGEIFSPAGWITWWEEGDYKRPECKVIPNEPPFNANPVRIYQGYYSGMCFTFFGRQHAGYYQVVENLTPGKVVEGWYYAHAWSCDEDNPPLSCGDPYAFSFNVGIDPNGGTDPFSDTIIWSAPQYIYDVYEYVGPVQAIVGENGAVTFFLRAHGRWSAKHNDAYWDNPTLRYVEP